MSPEDADSHIPLSEAEKKLGVTGLLEVAKKLGASESAARKWEGRGGIPAKYRTKLDKMSIEGPAQKPASTAGDAQVNFQVGFTFPGLDPTAIVREGKVENVREFLAWYERMADKALVASRSSPNVEPKKLGANG